LLVDNSIDRGGKKFYAGTNSGRVLMFDGTSLGLLSQLSHEEKLSSHDDHTSGGAVVQLRYCEQDEILVAAFAGGSVKVFSGCHRVVTEDITTALQTKTEADIEELLCPYFQGGGAPQTPLLLRVNERVHETTVMAMDVSDKLGLIAVSAVDGTVRVFDYHTLLIRAIYAAPFMGSQPVEVINLSFMPLTPVLIGADSNGRFTAWTCYPMKPLWILTWSLQTCFSNMYTANTAEEEKEKEEEEEKEKKKEGENDDSDSRSSGVKKRATSRKRRSSVTSMNSFASLEDDTVDDISNNTVISSMQCVVWKTSSRGIKTSTNIPSRINWNIIVGEGNGMISIIDMTDVFEKMGLHDFNQLKQAYRLNSSAMVYQTIRRADIKDGLEDFQIRELERGVRHPVGYNCFSNTRHGFKNISNKDVKGVIRWNAHTHGVGEIVCKQFVTSHQMHTRSHQKEFQAINATFKCRDFENIAGSPYVVVSSSEYGVPKRWSWTGQPLTDDYGGDMLQQAIALNTKVMNLDERDLKEKDLDGPQDLPSYPSGGAAQRLAIIVEWALPYIKTRISRAYDSQFASLPRNGARFNTQQSRESMHSPTDEGKSSPHKKVGDSVSDDEDDESTGVHDMFSPSRNKSGRQATPFVKDIVSIRRKVNEDKRRKEYSNQCWESKDRFPNHKSEVKKSERHHKDVSEEEVKELLGLIEEVKVIPESETAMRKSYSSFIQRRNEMRVTVNQKMDKFKCADTVAHKVMKPDATLEIDVSDSNDISERELFMLDIRQLRTTAPLEVKTSPPKSTPNGRNRKKGVYSSSSSKRTPTPMLGSAGTPGPVSKSGRRLLTKNDSLLNFSKEIEDVQDNLEEEEELKELGLTIKHRERVKSSRLESISSIKATMSRFDEITKTEEKKYSYTFNHDQAQLRGKHKKQKQTERMVQEDHRAVGHEDKQQQGSGSGGGGGVGGGINGDSGAGRYGPYKGRDIAAFEDFMSRLPPIHAALNFATIEFRVGEYFPQVLSSVHMGLVYEMSEILPIVLGLNNKSLSAMIRDLNIRLDGTFLREDLFVAMFAFASTSERVRIYKFAMIRAVLIEVFRTLNPPVPEVMDNMMMYGGKFASPGGGRHQTMMISPTKFRGGNVLFTESSQNQSQSQSQQVSSSPSKKLFKDKSNKSVTSEPKSSTAQATASTPFKNNNAPTRQVKAATGLEGWSMNRSILEDLKQLFDDCYVDRNGTVVGSEVIEISQFACSYLNLDKPPNMSFLALRRSFPLAPEVNSDLIAQFFEDVLRLEIKDDMGYHSRVRASSDASDAMDPGDDKPAPSAAPFSTPPRRGSGRTGGAGNTKGTPTAHPHRDRAKTIL
jgi:hypothetical protein